MDRKPLSPEELDKVVGGNWITEMTPYEEEVLKEYWSAVSYYSAYNYDPEKYAEAVKQYDAYIDTLKAKYGE